MQTSIALVAIAMFSLMGNTRQQRSQHLSHETDSISLAYATFANYNFGNWLPLLCK